MSSRQILDILATGHYETPSGRSVSIEQEQAAAEENTRLYSPDELVALRDTDPSGPRFSTSVEIVDATTQEAGHQWARPEGAAVLNFASARNPGGGFLTGAVAQEEELCRCSGLYPTLLTQRRYYDQNRSETTLLYTDAIIYSPRVPFVRVATKKPLLEQPFFASVITAPAPNAGALARSEPHSAVHLRATFERRWANVLAVAEHNRDRVLILGAWGCGAFRNEPALVAESAKTMLSSRRFSGSFERIVFAIPGKGERSRQNLQAFREVFAASSLG
ncbi:MAG TPA: TIGR02452 family protein [Polyangiaceae bacterium]